MTVDNLTLLNLSHLHSFVNQFLNQVTSNFPEHHQPPQFYFGKSREICSNISRSTTRIAYQLQNITSNKWSKKKWDKDPAEINKKHCFLLRGTCTIKPAIKLNLHPTIININIETCLTIRKPCDDPSSKIYLFMLSGFAIRRYFSPTKYSYSILTGEPIDHN